MIPTNNPFRNPGKFEQFTASFMSEDDKKPLLTWFNKFEKVLKKLGTNYQKSSIDPTDALEYYYDKKSPEEAAEALAEGVQLDEYIKKDGGRKRCAGGDGRRTGNSISSTELEERDEPEVVFDFKNERDAKQFAKDVENSAVGLANSGVERYKGKYRVVITGMKSKLDKKAIGKYAHKNKGEFSHSSSDVTPVGYGPKGEGRQLKNSKKEVMVVKNKKVIVIDREDLEKYEKRGWELAESVDEVTSIASSVESRKKVTKVLKKKGIGFHTSKGDIMVNPKNLIAAKSALNKEFAGDFETNSGMKLKGIEKVGISDEVELDENREASFTENDQKLLDFINKNW